MADNIIKRIVQLVLDKSSAKKTQDDANEVAAGIDRAWKDMASKVAQYLGVAFLIKKVVDFGKAAVAEARESESAWKNLKGTIDASGASFDAMEAKIRAAADAFQDATIHDDDAFAETLARMTTLTGDAAASLNNMGLVANVAAQFFNGELEPAAMLVAKAMNGNVTALQKMGIHAKDAQDALDILAQRSMGAATREASTFSGQLSQMEEQWKDVLKAVGEAIIQNDGATNAVSVLRAAIQALGQWVANNRDEIKLWVTNGVKFAIEAADVFIRAVTGMAEIIGGGLSAAIGLSVLALGKLVRGLAGASEIENRIRKFFGEDVTEREKVTKSIRDQADALEEWGKKAFNKGVDLNASGVGMFTKRLFSSEDFTKLPKPPELKVEKPMTSSNVVTDASQAVEKALKQFQEDTRAAASMQKVLGDQFDATGAEIDRTTKLLNVLTANGVDPASVGMGNLSGRLRDLITNIKPTEDATKALSKALNTDATLGALAAASATGQLEKQQEALAAQIKSLTDSGVSPQSREVQSLTDRYNGLQKAINAVDAHVTVDRLKQQQSDLLAAIRSMLDQGIAPTSYAVVELMAQFDALTDTITDAERAEILTQVYKELDEEIRSGLFMATLDQTDALAKQKAEQEALKNAIQKLISQGIGPEDRALQELVKRYKEVSKVIKEQTKAMELQAAAADVLAEALGAALQGGLHEAAVAKAKQNAIEAVEMLVRAGAFALFGNAPAASAALALAGQFAAVAAMWGAFAVATGGFGGGNESAGGGGGGSAGSDLSSSRASSSAASSRAEQPETEVSIYLVGPGFNAMNPKVQEVVYGAQKQAEQRFGPNARIRISSNSQ
jgi:hypothetical protein